MKDFKEVAEKIVFKNVIPLSKLTKSHHAFKDSVEKVANRLKQRK